LPGDLLPGVILPGDILPGVLLPGYLWPLLWLVKTISWIFTTNPKSCLVHTGLLQRMKVP
jgi:hypothetical protein